MKSKAISIQSENPPCCRPGLYAAPSVKVSYRCLEKAPGSLSSDRESAGNPSWEHGFPYEGRAAEVLGLAGLWSRSRWLHFLGEKGQEKSGDELSYSLSDIHSVRGELMEATLTIRDDERGTRHVLNVKRGGQP